jgi:prevent-host-death family protein
MSLELNSTGNRISLEDLKENPNDIVEDVEKRHSTKVITRSGKPSAIIISIEDYVQLKEAAEEAEAREIQQLYDEFLIAQTNHPEEIGTVDDLWKHFGLEKPVLKPKRKVL